ncbi:unnamed protein product [Schistosoma margrebowiei]|uniref:Ribosome biogenesis protein NSA1 n=1 Tax=Schistosoma margrebowiei TaxID=48269 RepID=A0AA84ZX67_9TREM|nr:unnamed protein product [Schistosoma margrebowiei]
MTTHSSGDIRVFSRDFTSEKFQLNASGLICSAKLAANQIVVGGKELALRVWDINNHSSPIFTAKNVRSSVLELSVPIWIADISVVPKSNGKLILTASRYGELDIYDLRCGQRRPVARHAWRTSRKHGKLHVGSGKHSAVLPDLTTTRPITKAVAYDNSPGIGLRVVAGNAVGELSVLDLRLPPEYSNLNSSDGPGVIPVRSYGSRAPDPPSGVRCLAGASGCITHLICSGTDEENTFPFMEAAVNSEPIIVASSLDRYLRIYNRDTGKRLGKIYVKVPVTSFLVRRNASFANIENFLKKDNDISVSNEEEKVESSYGISKTEQKEFEDLWNQIPVVDNDNDGVNEGGKRTTGLKIGKRRRKK